MTWSLLITSLIQLLAPLALKWLEDIFNRLSSQLSGKPGADPAVAVHDVFSAARGELSWWQFGKRRLLERAQRVATGRAAELAAAARDGLPPATLSGNEFDQIAGAD